MIDWMFAGFGLGTGLVLVWLMVRYWAVWWRLCATLIIIVTAGIFIAIDASAPHPRGLTSAAIILGLVLLGVTWQRKQA